jgi:hypothetical protein
VLWIVGPALPLLLYLAIARGIGRLQPPGWLLGTGRHVLAALLVSNLAIFTLRWAFGYRLGFAWWEPLAIAAAIIVAATVWTGILEMMRTRRAAAAPPATADGRTERARTVPLDAGDRLDADAAAAAMATTEQRGAVADALLAYLTGRYEVGVMCLVRDNLVIGWKGFGPGLDDDRIETLLVPLDAPSLFQAACAARDAVRGSPEPTALHDHVFKVLRCSPPSATIVAPIAIGPRIVNVLYAHHARGAPIDDAEHAELRRLIDAASEAYVRMISESKRKRRATEG